MENKSENNDSGIHFPVDREAPVFSGSEKKTPWNLPDIIIFLLISLTTVFTVSFSIYIIISKFS